MKITIQPRKKGFAPVAMADIAFLLLIFLIVTVSIGDAPEVKLPEFGYSRETGFPRTVIVTVAPDGAMKLDGSPVTLKSLPAAIVGMENPSEIVVNIQADAEAPYEFVDLALQALGGARLRKVVLMTEAPDDED